MTQSTQLTSEGGYIKRFPTVDKIVEELTQLRIKGYSINSMKNHLADKYGYKDSRGYELIRIARQELSDHYSQSKENSLEEAIGFMESLRDDCVKDIEMIKELRDITNDEEKIMKYTMILQKLNKEARENQDNLNKLHQLYVKKLEVESNIEQPLFNLPDKFKNKK